MRPLLANPAHLALTLSLAFATPGLAQSTVRGRVLRADGAVPLPGAEVVAEPSKATARTNGAGRFELRELPGNRVLLMVRAVGFAPTTRELDLVPGHVVTVEIALAQSTVALNPIITTATRTTQNLTDAPAATSVADTTAILAGRTVSLHETLRMMPGVVTASRYGSDDANIGIRGSAMRTRQGVRGVAVLLDGVPLTEPDGVARLDMIELAVARQVEVVRGPVSVLYGGSSGGVVNVLTRTGRESPGAVFRAQVGDYGLEKYDAWAGAPVGGGRASLLAAGSWTWTRGWREHADAEIARGTARADLVTDAGTRLTLEADGSTLNSTLPGSLTQTEFDTDPAMASPLAISNGSARGDTRYRVGTRIDHAWPETALNGYLFLGGRTLDFPIPGQVVDLDLRRAQAGARIRARDLAAGAVVLTLGFDGDVVYGSDRRWTNQGGAPGELKDDGEFSVRGLAPYLQGEWHMRGDMDLTLGLRYDNVRYHFESQSPGMIPEQRTVLDQLSPKATLSWRSGGSATLYGSVARGFEVPAIGELSPSPGEPLNTTLRPKSLWNYEVGGRYFAGSWLLLDAALFYADVTGEFVPRSADGVSLPENASSSRNIGLELAATARPAPWFDAGASYTWSDFQLLDYRTAVRDASGAEVEMDYSGNRLPGIPRHRLTMQVRAWPGERMNLGAQVEWQSLVYVETGNAVSGATYVGPPGATPVAVPFRAVPARALVHLDGHWDAGPFGVFASLENAFGLRSAGNVIVNDLNGRYYEPGPGRVLTAGIRLRLARPQTRPTQERRAAPATRRLRVPDRVSLHQGL